LAADREVNIIIPHGADHSIANNAKEAAADRKNGHVENGKKQVEGKLYVGPMRHVEEL
jgi:hypothetical protein